MWCLIRTSRFFSMVFGYECIVTFMHPPTRSPLPRIATTSGPSRTSREPPEMYQREGRRSWLFEEGGIFMLSLMIDVELEGWMSMSISIYWRVGFWRFNTLPPVHHELVGGNKLSTNSSPKVLPVACVHNIRISVFFSQQKMDLQLNERQSKRGKSKSSL